MAGWVQYYFEIQVHSRRRARAASAKSYPIERFPAAHCAGRISRRTAGARPARYQGRAGLRRAVQFEV